MLVKSGTYAGNGTDNRSIFVGFQPDIVIVDIEAGVTAAPDEAVIRTSTMAGDRAKDLDGPNAPVANKIQSLDATGFTLGTHATVNGAGLTYHWVAFRAAPGTLKVGFYVGDGLTDNRSITGIGFQPEYVIVMPNNAARVVQRTSDMPGDLTHDFSSLASVDQIQALEADGFQVGLDPTVNAANVTYYYAAWSVTPGEVAVGVYTGDGVTDNRNIAGLGFAPEHVMVNRSLGAPGAGGSASVHKMASTGVGVDKALLFDGRLFEVDNIQALQANGFQVGLHVRVNAGAAPNTYYWVAFGPRAPTTNYRSIGTAADYGTGTISVTAGSTTVTGAVTSWRLANRGRGDVMTIPCPNPPTCTGGVHYTVASVATDADLQLTQGYAGATAGGVTYLLRRTFSTLTAWEDCVDGPPGAACPFFPVASTNLIADNRSEVGIAYDDAVGTDFAGGLVIDGSGTDATHTITLTADGANRHYGLPGQGVLINNGASVTPAVSVFDDLVTVEWMEITGGGGTADGIRVNLLSPGTGSLVTVRNNLIRNITGDGVAIYDPDGRVDVVNNIVHGCTTAACSGIWLNSGSLLAGSRFRILNNTIHANASGIAKAGAVSAAATLLLRNNISVGSTAFADFDCDPGDSVDPASSNNLDEDGSSGAGAGTHNPAGGQVTSTVANLRFVSTTPGSENLHLRQGSTAQNNGADLSAIFTTDIDEEVRRTPWDRGADDVRGVVNYRSIGTLDYATGTVSATSGSTSITGTGTAWLFNNRGRGDVITIPCPALPACAGGTHYTILSVSADNQLTLTTPFAGATGPYTYAIRRQFATLAAWETCIDGNPCGYFPVASASLVADDRSEVGIAYKDSPLARVTIGASAITDALHTITLTADPGNRHLGIPGNGVVVDNGINPLAVVLVQNDFVTVEWLEVIGGLDEGVEWDTASPGANQGIARNLLVHGVTLEGILLDDPDLNVEVYNNIVYSTDTGIRIGAALVTGTIRVFNNTVYGNAVGGITAAGSNPSVTLGNNISHSNGSDYSVANLNGSSRNNLASNLTGTTHSPGGGGLNSVPLANLMFVSTTLGAEDLHIQAGSAAENNGADLRSVFNTDIDGGLRQLPWDRGADDIGATTAVTLLSFEASGLDRAVDLTWVTASELRNLGFHLYRSPSPDGPWERITSSLVPGLGSSPTGAGYAWRNAGLVNGTTYHYLLEDVETTGKMERHGPVAATPQPSGSGGGAGSGGDGSGAGDGSGGPGDGSDDGAGGSAGNDGSGSGRITWGDPSGASLRTLERGPSHVVLELLTPGFTAATDTEGTVRVSIPGFEDTALPGTLDVPVRHALVEALAGRRVRLASVTPEDVVSFDAFRLAAASTRDLVVREDGILRTGASPRRLLEPHRRGGFTPRTWARLLGSLYQGETKKARLELSPFRHDPLSGKTLLARRLTVRVEFAGQEAGERSLGGSRGRRPPSPTLRRSGVLAHLVAKAPGLYRVRFEDLFPSGLRGLPARTLRLSRRGAPVPYHMEPARPLFAQGSSLFFFNEGTDPDPRGESVFELSLGQTASFMEAVSGAPSGPSTGEYLHTLRLEQDKFYQSALLEAPDLWLWDLLVSPVTKSYPFTVEALSPSSTSGHLKVVLQGASDFEAMDHHLRLSVNGLPVAEVTWDGKTEQTVSVDLTAGVLAEGPNTLALENVGDAGAAYSMVFLNRFEVSYPRLLVSTSGTLEGRFDQSGRAEVTGLTGPAFVLDTTASSAASSAAPSSAASPVWLRDTDTTPAGLAFRVETGHRYLAVSESALLIPEVRRSSGSRLRNTSTRADWVLIAPREFLPAAQPLVDLRRRQGLLPLAVATEDVFAEFGFGEARPQAVRDFLAFAFHNWKTRPRYAVLLGDTTYDPKNHLGTGVKDRVPSPLLQTTYLWTVSDPSLAAVNGSDLLPDLAIGRLSAGTLAEAERLVDKLVAFEEAGRTFDGTAVLVADNADLAGNFEADQDEIAATILQGRDVEKVYVRDLGGATRTTIRAALDSGPGLVSYVGHGATAVWASENVWNNTDLATLSAQGQQPLLLTLNCLNGFFHFPPFDSLAEAFVKAEGKGALAAFSPSGLSVNGAAHLYHKALLAELAAGSHSRMGDALLAAQKAYADTGAMPELLSIYHLFGDPGMQIR